MDLQERKKYTFLEIEKMNYYDFMAYLGVPFFHIGGPKSTEELAAFCNIRKESNVLVVGSGSGFSACHLAEKIGCFVTGVDIAEESVKNAMERSIRQNVAGNTRFILADAYELPFNDQSFDVVITEFVSQFLDQKKAFKEFRRVLKNGGCMGINEMYKDDTIKPEIGKMIVEGENLFSKVTGLNFGIHTARQWQEYFEEAGFSDIEIHRYRPFQNISDGLVIIKAMGGILAIIKVMVHLLKYMLLSKIIRERFLKLGRGKRILFDKKATSKHVGYILATAKK